MTSYDQSAPSIVLRDPLLLKALCGKYEKLCDLRQRQITDVAPRAELVALAAAFPGALRELDCLPLDELERRLLALRAVDRDNADIEQWMILQIAYHGFMRAVLRLRRLLRAAHADSPDSQTLLRYRQRPDEPAPQRFDAEALATIRKPPGGRLNPWVLEQVARDHAVTRACIETALWGARKGSLP